MKSKYYKPGFTEYLLDENEDYEIMVFVNPDDSGLASISWADKKNKTAGSMNIPHEYLYKVATLINMYLASRLGEKTAIKVSS